jgi:hypothetical protein
MFIAAAGNVEVPAYLCILSKGYTVYSERGLMVAERGLDRFMADGALELLGVITMAESRGENWWATEEQIDDYLAKFVDQ